MIKTETIQVNGRDFIKTYSDIDGYGVKREGIVYREALDPVEFASERQYTEALLPIGDKFDEYGLLREE